MTPTKANLRRAEHALNAYCVHTLDAYVGDCLEYIALALDAAERRACRGLARLYEKRRQYAEARHRLAAPDGPRQVAFWRQQADAYETAARLSESDLATLRGLVALAKKATPGPWKRYVAAPGAASQVVTADETLTVCSWPVRSAHDARFIAAARNAVGVIAKIVGEARHAD